MNSYFQFKRFKIEQDKCAMKVSTDACIQGAWASLSSSAKRVLDIGTGTGLLSLMLAQRIDNVFIDAVELDAEAYQQACGNVQHSPWQKRICVIYSDIKNYRPDLTYDYIISNPPFFQNSLHGEDAARNTARHTDTLRYNELLNVIDRLLNPEGEACILLPFEQHKVWAQLIKENGWFIIRELHVQPNAQKAANRVVSICSRIEQPKCVDALVIYERPQVYTAAFARLLSPYYLNL